MDWGADTPTTFPWADLDLDSTSYASQRMSSTLQETNILAAENGWLEY